MSSKKVYLPMSQQTLLDMPVGSRKGGNTKASFSALSTSKNEIPSEEENSLRVPRSRGASNSSLSMAPALIPSGNPEATFQSYTDGKVKQLFENLRSETVLCYLLIWYLIH
jgi:hypothetical protein